MQRNWAVFCMGYHLASYPFRNAVALWYHCLASPRGSGTPATLPLPVWLWTGLRSFWEADVHWEHLLKGKGSMIEHKVAGIKSKYGAVWGISLKVGFYLVFCHRENGDRLGRLWEQRQAAVCDGLKLGEIQSVLVESSFTVFPYV